MAARGQGLPCRWHAGYGRSTFHCGRSRAAISDFQLNPSFRTNPTGSWDGGSVPLSDIRKLGRPAILKTASARGVKLFTHAREAMHFIIQFVPFEHEGTSPYFSHHLCMIGRFAGRLVGFFADVVRRGVGGRERCLNDIWLESSEGVSAGLGVMPRGLRVAAARVRRARRERWRRRDEWQRSPRHRPPDMLTPSRP